MYCPTCSAESELNSRFCGNCGTNLSEVDTSEGLQQPKVGFGGAIGRGFSNYFNFSGRATRAEYWWWILFNFLVVLIPIVNWVSWLIFLIPNISLTTRRLHDIGKTGWWQLGFMLASVVTWGTFIVALIIGILAAFGGESIEGLFVLSAVAFIAAIATTVWAIVWLARQGDTGSNKYGPDPRTTPRS
mgnify:CR=1 FL=1